MTVSWFLLLVICIMVVVLLTVNVYLLVHYSHPDDKNEAYLPKILCVSRAAGESKLLIVHLGNMLTRSQFPRRTDIWVLGGTIVYSSAPPRCG